MFFKYVAFAFTEIKSSNISDDSEEETVVTLDNPDVQIKTEYVKYFRSHYCHSMYIGVLYW